MRHKYDPAKPLLLVGHDGSVRVQTLVLAPNSQFHFREAVARSIRDDFDRTLSRRFYYREWSYVGTVGAFNVYEELP